MRALQFSLALLSVVALAGCADHSWHAVQRRDTVAAYHQFLRDHPDSPYKGEAEERLAYLRVRRNPTIEAFEDFVRDHPHSPLKAELHDFVEGLYFESARLANTEGGYALFLSFYPRGKFVARATGNLAYVKHVRDDPQAEKLRAFVREHPASDFAAEAQRRLALIEFFEKSRIRRLAARVEVDPTVGQSNRVRQGFLAVIAKAYGEVGIEVVPMRGGGAVPDYADAWMRVDYHEAPASGLFGGDTLLSHCRVRVFHREVEEPIWDRKFEAPADHVLKGAYGRDKTVFGNSKYRFWEQFFVPTTTWAASGARVNRVAYLDEIQDVDVHGETAAVLLRRGNVDIVDISSPKQAKTAARYRRESDLALWTGVRVLDESRFVIFGRDGIEVLERTETEIIRKERFEVGEVGFVRAVAPFNEHTVLAAGDNGVFAIRWEGDRVVSHRMLDGDFVGVEVLGELVYLARDKMIEVANAKHLLRHVTGAKIPLPQTFGAYRLQRGGDQLFLFGRPGVARLDLSKPTRPALGDLLEPSEVGGVTAVAAGEGYLYLLGARGFQVAGQDGAPRDTIQVEGNRALQVRGTYAFLVGENTLEVIDLAPYHTATDTPAAPAR